MNTDMAHLDVSLDDVIAAADTLQDQQQPVTIDTVRSMIGAGSTMTIHQHLAVWRSSHAKAPEAPTAELPPALLAELSQWALQVAQDAGAGLREAVARADSDINSLLAAGGQLEAERNAVNAELAERNEDIERLTAELRNARQIAADALVGKAKDQLAIDGKDAQLADLRQQLERNVAATAAESDARLRAQMELVGVTTERDNAVVDARELNAKLDASRTERSKLRAELEILRAQVNGK